MNKILPFEMVFFPLAGGMLVVALCCTYLPNPFAHHPIAKDAPTHIDKCNDPAISAVIYSIRTDPTSWSTDNYRMNHGDDISIWVGNSDYGLNIQLGKDASPVDKNTMDDDCRQVLYQTTQDWYKNYLNSKLRVQ